MGFRSSCDGDFREPLVLPQVSLVSFPVARWSQGELSSHCEGILPHLHSSENLVVLLELQREGLHSCQLVVCVLGNLLSCIVGVTPSFRVLQGNLGLLSRHCRVKGPHPTLRGKSHDFSKLRQEAWASSRVPTGTSGNLSCFLREVRSPFEL